MKCSSMIDLRTYGPNNEGTLTGDASLCLTLLPSPCGTQQAARISSLFIEFPCIIISLRSCSLPHKVSFPNCPCLPILPSAASRSYIRAGAASPTCFPSHPTFHILLRSPALTTGQRCAPSILDVSLPLYSRSLTYIYSPLSPLFDARAANPRIGTRHHDFPPLTRTIQHRLRHHPHCKPSDAPLCP